MSDTKSEPALPEPAYSDLDSMLSRKFGREVANYFSGSPLNRVSFLRTDNVFLQTALKHKTTSFILFNSLQPLVKSPSNLAFTTLDDVRPLIGDKLFDKPEEQLIDEFNSSVFVPQTVFLGLDERRSDGLVWKDVYKGAPVFAVDVTPKSELADTATKLIADMEGRGLSFQEGRMILTLNADDAAIYAQARAMIDWNSRNPFCSGCGQPTLSVNAGGKRTCPPKDAAGIKGVVGNTSGAEPISAVERPPCATRNTISNISFPRTDPTVIMAVVSHDSKRIMLGRQKRWPPYWYSTLAGFLEPGESVEEAVRREVWEEAGVKVGRVVIHSSQPWPYPANLMLGAIAQTIPDGETIDLGNDPELGNARWCEFDEVREALRVGTSGLGDPPGPEYVEGGLRLPPPTAIANRLITSVVSGFVSGDPKM